MAVLLWHLTLVALVLAAFAATAACLVLWVPRFIREQCAGWLCDGLRVRWQARPLALVLENVAVREELLALVCSYAIGLLLQVTLRSLECDRVELRLSGGRLLRLAAKAAAS